MKETQREAEESLIQTRVSKRASWRGFSESRLIMPLPRCDQDRAECWPWSQAPALSCGPPQGSTPQATNVHQAPVPSPPRNVGRPFPGPRSGSLLAWPVPALSPRSGPEPGLSKPPLSYSQWLALVCELTRARRGTSASGSQSVGTNLGGTEGWGAGSEGRRGAELRLRGEHGLVGEGSVSPWRKAGPPAEHLRGRGGRARRQVAGRRPQGHFLGRRRRAGCLGRASRFHAGF